MFRDVFLFELRYRFRQPSTYIYFGILFALGFIFLAVEETGDRVQMPVTYEILSLINNGFGLFFLIITTVYSGELVWRERETKLQLVFDALPMPNWVPFLSKLLALVGTQVLLYAALVLVGVGVAIPRLPRPGAGFVRQGLSVAAG